MPKDITFLIFTPSEGKSLPCKFQAVQLLKPPFLLFLFLFLVNSQLCLQVHINRHLRPWYASNSELVRSSNSVWNPLPDGTIGRGWVRYVTFPNIQSNNRTNFTQWPGVRKCKSRHWFELLSQAPFFSILRITSVATHWKPSSSAICNHNQSVLKQCFGLSVSEPEQNNCLSVR